MCWHRIDMLKIFFNTAQKHRCDEVCQTGGCLIGIYIHQIMTVLLAVHEGIVTCIEKWGLWSPLEQTYAPK